MTLKEIQKQIDEAKAAPLNEDGTSEYFNLLPRVYYSELPAKLKAEADKITIDEAKRFLLELYPVGALDRFLGDPIELNLKIGKALHAAKYLVESTKTTSTGAAGSVSLIGADFAAAWEDVAGIKDSLTAEQVREVLPHLSSITPKKHLMPNNKLANSLTKEILNAGAFNLKVGGKGATEIKSRCILSYEGDNIKLSSRQSFTEYDRSVADAVTSLYEYGDESHIVTAATVYRAMTHATETETPSPQQIGAVTRSLDKLRFVRVQIDCSEELTKRKLSLDGEQITGGKIDTYLLALKAIEVIAGGQVVKAYKVLETPILYEYSRLTGQVITVQAKLLDIRDKTGAKIANTERRISIKSYLLRRISVMKGKNGKNTSRKILYETLYDEICDDRPTEKEQRNIRDYVPQALDYWQRCGFIKGYTETTQGRKKTGVEINI